MMLLQQRAEICNQNVCNYVKSLKMWHFYAFPPHLESMKCTLELLHWLESWNLVFVQPALLARRNYENRIQCHSRWNIWLYIQAICWSVYWSFWFSIVDVDWQQFSRVSGSRVFSSPTWRSCQGLNVGLLPLKIQPSWAFSSHILRIIWAFQV